jgi:hypothetical protein
LLEAWKEYQKPLLLSGGSYLRAFHYPHFGNAMSKLCDWLDLNGMFRGYAEDRYDRMIRKHGPVNDVFPEASVVEDEEDYYSEPELDESDYREAA